MTAILRRPDSSATTPTPLQPTKNRGPRRFTVRALARHSILILASLVWMLPLYLLVVNAFKPQEAILGAPFRIDPGELTLQYVFDALTSREFNVPMAYGFTALLVVLNVIMIILVCGPVAYVIARGTRRRHTILMFYFLMGIFIPGQVTLISAVQVLRQIGLLNTLPGLLAYQICTAIPTALFLYVAYIRSIPPSLDEAASIDGAGRLRTFWMIIFPLMRPIVVTNLILNAMGIWNDFVHPQIILGPFGPKTVTTGVYAALGQFSSYFTVVYPNLLLTMAPALIFFVIMQRRIVGGLTEGATK